MINLIVAISSNNVIGVGNDLPWRIKEDMIHFKNKTIDNICIMGRKTWDSIPKKPLKNRYNIVISRDNCGENDASSNVFWFNDLHYSLSFAKEIAESLGKEIWIIGGSAIYKGYLPLVTDLHVTHVDKHIPDDVNNITIDLELSKFDIVSDSVLSNESKYVRYKRK